MTPSPIAVPCFRCRRAFGQCTCGKGPTAAAYWERKAYEWATCAADLKEELDRERAAKRVWIERALDPSREDA